MRIKSWLRGHPIVWINKKWIYKDDGSDIPKNSNKERTCIKCEEFPTSEDHDFCLGNLLGVKYACCGHGIKENAYIIFKDG